jgi:Ca2+-binding RTX toxin-like protein
MVDATNLQPLQATEQVIFFGTPADDYVVGTENADGMLGGGGSNTFIGLGGDDYLITSDYNVFQAGPERSLLDGGDGNDFFGSYTLNNDTIIGGEGIDTLALVPQPTETPLHIDLSTGSGSFRGSTFSSIEQLQASGGYNASGQPNDDTIIGGTGNDSITGEAGRDLLSGGPGDDLMSPGFGAGLAFGGDGNDSLTAYGSGATVYGNAGNDTLVEAPWGNSGGLAHGGPGIDTLVGDVPFLGRGSTSNVTLAGDAGDDIYVIHDAGYQISERPPGGVDAVQTDLAAYTLPRNVEILSDVGNENFLGIGNSSSNILSGGPGDDTLSGLAGKDTLDGGLGTDVLTGGKGGDEFEFSVTQAQGDRVTDFGGHDVLVFMNFGPGPTLTEQGTSDLWTISYGAGQEETIRLDGVHALHNGDYVFV